MEAIQRITDEQIELSNAINGLAKHYTTPIYRYTAQEHEQIAQTITLLIGKMENNTKRLPIELNILRVEQEAGGSIQDKIKTRDN